MKQPTRRAQKVQHLLHEGVVQFFQKEGLASLEWFVTHVRVSNDLKIARIYIYAPRWGEKEKKKLREDLHGWKKELKRFIAQNLYLKYVPDIQFCFDAQWEKQLALQKKLEEIS